jgi:tetratricopeptide (TPR) repeat protein
MVADAGSDFDAFLAQGIKAHQSGIRERAKFFYSLAARISPDDPYLLYLQGALCFEGGDANAAFLLLQRSASLRSPDVPTLSLMGAVCAALGKYENAASHFAIIVEREPNSAIAHANLGKALYECKRYSEAVNSFENSNVIRPLTSELMLDLGNAYLQLGDAQKAIETLRRSASIDPHHKRTLILLTRMLVEQDNGDMAIPTIEACLSRWPNDSEALLLAAAIYYDAAKLQESEAALFKLLALRPDDAMAYMFLSAIHLAVQKVPSAERLARRAYQINSRNAEIITNLGHVLQAKGSYQESLGLLQRAIGIAPNLPEAWNGLGLTYQQLGRFNDALNCYDASLKLRPGFQGALANRSLLLLSTGRLAEGWQSFGSRFNQKLLGLKRRNFLCEPWKGVADQSTRLLLWTDQGLGDEILFGSVLNQVRDKVAACMLECTPRMVPLLKRSFPWVDVVARTKVPCDSIARFRPTHHASISDLGGYFRGSIEDFPAHQGYLVPNQELSSNLRQKYRSLANGRRVVGISWRSDSFSTGQHKSLPLSYWEPILNNPDVLFVSLQYGLLADESQALAQETGNVVFVEQAVDAKISPDDFAAQVAAMDLVVTISNTTAHFAGALNIPVWTLLPQGAGTIWYWFHSRSDSPWYPSMTLFRQETPGDWRSVVSSVASRLSKWSNVDC